MMGQLLTKPEMVRIHSFLESFKNYCEATQGFDFSEYNALHISSDQTSVAKKYHKHAVEVLSKELVDQMIGESR